MNSLSNYISIAMHNQVNVNMFNREQSISWETVVLCITESLYALLCESLVPNCWSYLEKFRHLGLVEEVCPWSQEFRDAIPQLFPFRACSSRCEVLAFCSATMSAAHCCSSALPSRIYSPLTLQENCQTNHPFLL